MLSFVTVHLIIAEKKDKSNFLSSIRQCVLVCSLDKHCQKKKITSEHILQVKLTADLQIYWSLDELKKYQRFVQHHHSDRGPGGRPSGYIQL